MSITSDYTAVPPSALIDDQVQCPGCGQPLNVDHPWAQKLRVTRRVMLCCTRQLTDGEVGVLLGRVRRARQEAV